MKIIGLTGPSGAGKTDIANIFKARGFLCLDADKIYKEVVLKAPDYKKSLVSAFSEEIIGEDGEIDRKVLGGIVFSDPEKLAILNELAHERMRTEIFKILGENEAQSVAVVDAPQLFESNLLEDCTIILSVIAPKEERIGRIMARDHISRETALLRVSAQHPDEFFIEHSDFVLRNDKDRATLLEKANKVMDQILLHI